jgi:hypothetical protein
VTFKIIINLMINLKITSLLEYKKGIKVLRFFYLGLYEL